MSFVARKSAFGATPSELRDTVIFWFGPSVRCGEKSRRNRGFSLQNRVWGARNGASCSENHPTVLGNRLRAIQSRSRAYRVTYEAKNPEKRDFPKIFRKCFRFSEIWFFRGTFAEPSGRSTSDLENIRSKLFQNMFLWKSVQKQKSYIDLKFATKKTWE